MQAPAFSLDRITRRFCLECSSPCFESTGGPAGACCIPSFVSNGEPAMIRRNSVLVIGCLGAVALMAGNRLSSLRQASAQPPRAAPKWEYGTLSYDEPIGPEY